MFGPVVFKPTHPKPTHPNHWNPIQTRFKKFEMDQHYFWTWIGSQSMLIQVWMGLTEQGLK
jgi:hypothetical protein